MKTQLKLLVLSVISFLCFQACVDKDYDFDNINKDGHFNIPPVPLGSIDTIFLKDLVDVPIIHIPDSLIPNGIGVTLAYTDTIKGIFNEDVNTRFFYDGAADVSLSIDTVDLRVMTASNGVKMRLGIDVLDSNGAVISGVKVPSLDLEYGLNFNKRILFASEYIKYMGDASDLKLTLVFNITSIGNVYPDNYLLMKGVVLRSGGISFEF